MRLPFCVACYYCMILSMYRGGARFRRSIVAVTSSTNCLIRLVRSVSAVLEYACVE